MSLSIDLRKRIVKAYEKGEGSIRKLAKSFQVGEASVWRLVSRYQRKGIRGHRITGQFKSTQGGWYTRSD
jgi:transposase